MILNTKPTSHQWNDSVNTINIQTQNKYNKIEASIDEVDRTLKAVKDAIIISREARRQLQNKVAFLTLLVENY